MVSEGLLLPYSQFADENFPMKSNLNELNNSKRSQLPKSKQYSKIVSLCFQIYLIVPFTAFVGGA